MVTAVDAAAVGVAFDIDSVISLDTIALFAVQPMSYCNAVDDELTPAIREWDKNKNL